MILRLVTAALLVSTAAQAQAPAADDVARRDVLAVVKRLFDGMRTKDSTLARSTLHKNATLMSALQPTDKPPTIQVDSIDAWLRSIATPRPDVLDERTRNEIVHIDGTLATVWAEYSLYVGPRLNHCGVDAFQLAKDADGWKILSIVDTRRRTGCAEIPAK
jgi:hypothetical protein